MKLTISGGKTTPPITEGWYYAQKKAELGYTGCPIQPTRVVGDFPFPMYVLEWGGTTEWALSDYDWYGPVPEFQAAS